MTNSITVSPDFPEGSSSSLTLERAELKIDALFKNSRVKLPLSMIQDVFRYNSLAYGDFLKIYELVGKNNAALNRQAKAIKTASKEEAHTEIQVIFDREQKAWLLGIIDSLSEQLPDDLRQKLKENSFDKKEENNAFEIFQTYIHIFFKIVLKEELDQMQDSEEDEDINSAITNITAIMEKWRNLIIDYSDKEDAMKSGYRNMFESVYTAFEEDGFTPKEVLAAFKSRLDISSTFEELRINITGQKKPFELPQSLFFQPKRMRRTFSTPVSPNRSDYTPHTPSGLRRVYTAPTPPTQEL